MGVDQILHRMPGRTATAWFSAFLTKCHLAMRGRKSNPQLEFDRFPQIHSAHHNNKLYGLTDFFSKTFHKYCLLLLLGLSCFGG